jgi:glucan endo-1,3-beta-D-glucosidase
MRTSTAAILTLVAEASAVYQGFNYASTNGDGSARTTSDFTEYFTTAQNLVGTSGFASARLYTMIQGGSTADPIEAIEAAIATNTTLLLGLWTSGALSGFQNELTALKSAISTYGSKLAAITAGISVGSEDLYRNSPTGIAASAGVGIGPDLLVSYISQVKSAISGTALSSAKIGHVDTWTAWANTSNSAVTDACDFLGFDAYPYFQNTMTNDIGVAKSLFEDAIAQVNAVSGGKEIWVTETGWPTSGSTQNLAVASTANAATYWQTVGCALFGKVNTWWYILSDTGASPSFGIVSDPSSTTPLYSLSCNSTAAAATINMSGSSATTSSSSSSATGSSSSGSGSGSSGTYSNSTVTSSTKTATATTSTSATSSSTATTSSTATSGGITNAVSAATALLAVMAAMFSL